jgi:hypothetical protein
MIHLSNNFIYQTVGWFIIHVHDQIYIHYHRLITDTETCFVLFLSLYHYPVSQCSLVNVQRDKG